ncbi:isochorismatase family protein [Streptomyces luomodiensis]|uniref:Isochorismatase family protein n=1 Tax=Streptomyces luomodiensis TaxID=3026192 RepID=A0ABY9V0E8_9ACTN|nr:isochorismatase family protein [Streptomyces sp. SCA4-21]WNE95559.1 isochorismatase family protein [Streptomyces sp. SCA4-21]
MPGAGRERRARHDQPTRAAGARSADEARGPQRCSQGIDTLVLGGVHTSGVVLSTVREATGRDYRLLVLGDVCADPDPQLHRTLMDAVLPMQADIVDTAAFEAAVGAP